MNYEPEAEFEGPSKSQLKRDAHKLQALGARLTTCSETQLRTLELPEKTIAAIQEYNRLPNSHGARRRQMQFIGKLMRDCDYDQLNTALEQLEKGLPHQKKAAPESQVWLQQILRDGDAAINALVDAHEQFERQKLRQFYRDCQATDDAARARAEGKLLAYLDANLDA